MPQPDTDKCDVFLKSSLFIPQIVEWVGNLVLESRSNFRDVELSELNSAHLIPGRRYEIRIKIVALD